MQLGAILPQLEMQPTPDELRAAVVAIEEMGYSHLALFDHVVGVDPEAYPGWKMPYNVDSLFHEPMVLMGFLAAITNLELVTSILILPQRQATLVAKQAAEVDLLCGGRLRLGVGVGWNEAEYEALGVPFGNRGRRQEEQIALMRKLWCERSVTFSGEFHQLKSVGIAPRPLQQPIPIWLGGSSSVAYQRIGRLADGWFPQVRPGERLEAALREIQIGAVSVGRDPSEVSMEGRVSFGPGGLDNLDKVAEQAEAWRNAGASHLAINTMGAGFSTLHEHSEAFMRAIELINQ